MRGELQRISANTGNNQLLRPVAAPAEVARTKVGKQQSALQSSFDHWPEYLIEAGCLGTFMLSACVFAVLLAHPASPLVAHFSEAQRRLLGGVAMGLTAIALIYSPPAQRSGAHMNPSVTLTFYRLGKMARRDAMFYAIFQFLGALAGTLMAYALLRSALAHERVGFAITAPRPGAELSAFTWEAVISFVLMTTVLNFSNSKALARYTGVAAGVLVMLFITVESPISGMSMNPARSFATDLVGMHWRGLWIYFVAPVVGMLAAAELYVRTRGIHSVICAKLNHSGGARCIFHCGYRKNPLTVLSPEVDRPGPRPI